MHCASARLLGTSNRHLDLLNQIDDTSEICTLLGRHDKTWNFCGSVKLRYSVLSQPLYLEPGAQVFVCGFSDLFHKDVPFEFVSKCC